MNLNSLTEEQKKKLNECSTPEEYLALAKEVGYELSDDELAKVAGGDVGMSWSKPTCCPKCGSTNIEFHIDVSSEQTGFGGCVTWWVCNDCSFEWN